MLSTLRESAHGFFAKMLMLLLVLSFGIWGIGDIFRQGGGANTVATVGSTSISQREYQVALHRRQEELRQAMGASYKPEMLEKLGIESIIIDGLISDVLAEKEATALGIVVGDKEIRQAIASDPNFADRDGRFDKSIFLSVLNNNNMSEQQYVSGLRAAVTKKLLKDAILNGVEVPDELARALYRSRQEQRTANLYVLTASAIKQVPQATEKDIDTYYANHPEQFSAPEIRTVSYVVLKPADISSKIAVSEDEIKHAYEDRKQEFQEQHRTLEQAHAEIAKDLTSKAAQETLYKFVGDLEDLLGGGATLESAADKIGQKVQTFGPVTHEGLSADGKKLTVPPYDNFINVAFSTAEKDHSQSVQTSDGSYYLLYVDKVIPEHVRPLSEVKAKATAAWEAQKKHEMLQALADAVSRDIVAGKSPAEALAKHGAPVSAVSSGKITRGTEVLGEGPLAKHALPQSLVGELFSLHAGASTHAHPAEDGSYMIATLQQVTPAPAIKASDAVSTDALNTIQQELRETIARERMQQYLVYLSNKYSVTRSLVSHSKDEEGSE